AARPRPRHGPQQPRTLPGRARRPGSARGAPGGPRPYPRNPPAAARHQPVPRRRARRQPRLPRPAPQPAAPPPRPRRTPRPAAGDPARGVVLAFGKLGGEELNYSSDIDLMFVYDAEGETRGRRPIGNEDFFGRVVTELVRLLSAFTDRGQAYRVDLRLRPEGQRGPLARTLAATLSYYDRMGRTWERQALIKLRPVAGDRPLREGVLRGDEPLGCRQYS